MESREKEGKEKGIKETKLPHGQGCSFLQSRLVPTVALHNAYLFSPVNGIKEDDSGS